MEDDSFLDRYNLEVMVSGRNQLSGREEKFDMAIFDDILMMEANERMSPAVPSVPTITAKELYNCNGRSLEQCYADYDKDAQPRYSKPYYQPTDEWNCFYAQYSEIGFNQTTNENLAASNNSGISRIGQPVNSDAYDYPEKNDFLAPPPSSLPLLNLQNLKIQPPIRYNTAALLATNGTRIHGRRTAQRGRGGRDNKTKRIVPFCDDAGSSSRRCRRAPKKSGHKSAVEKHREKQKMFISAAPGIIENLQYLLSVVSKSNKELGQFEKTLLDMFSKCSGGHSCW